MLPRALATLLALWFAAAASAQDKALPRIRVTCVDGNGQPVANAEVHVFQFRKSPTPITDYVMSGPHRTDAEGVAVTTVALEHDGGQFDRWFHARVPGKWVGGMRWFRMRDTTVGEPVVRMVPTRELRGRVAVPEGAKPRTVRVRTLSVSVGDSPFGQQLPRYFQFAGLRDTLPDLFDAEVADDGSFVLHDLPDRSLLYLAAEGQGLAQAQWFNALLPERRIPDVVEIAMTREARFAGSVVDATGKAIAGASVTLHIDRSQRSAGVQFPFETRTDGAGSFDLGGLPAGDFRLQVEHTTGCARPLAVRLVAGQQQKDQTIQLDDGVELRGIVRGLPSGVGVERVGISAITADDHHWPIGFVQTDPQGRFALRIAKGPALLYVNGVPPGFQQPPSTYDQLLRIDAQPDDRTLTQIVFELAPAK